MSIQRLLIHMGVLGRGGGVQEGEELPKDFTTMFNDDLFRMHTNYVPEAVRLYALLDVKKVRA